jgi:uncharacterized repeat protein (TIGR02543 family)
MAAACCFAVLLAIAVAPATAQAYWRCSSRISMKIETAATFASNTFTIAPILGANGSISPSATQTVESGGGAVFTIEPTVGYDIADVIVDGNSVGAVSSYAFADVTADHTISATFVLKTYTLTYQAAGCNGSIVGQSTQMVAYGANGATVTATPTRTGYRFVQWSDTGSTCAVRQDLGVTGNISATASFSNTYTVSFESNGVTVNTVDGVVYNTSLGRGMPPDPIRTGDTFTGWNTASDGSGAVFGCATPVRSTITVYAQWTHATCRVTFRVNGCSGSNRGSFTQVVDYGGVATLPVDPTRSGCAFAGWYVDPGLTACYEFATPVTNDITLYAKWVADHTIWFDSEGGSAVAAITKPSGSLVATPTAPTRSGYTFAGWYTSCKLRTPYAFTTMPDSDITVYAKWIKGRTISFDSQGGSAVAHVTAACGSAVTAPNPPTKPGYTFAGWYTTSKLRTPYTFTTMPDRDITLYAKWTASTCTAIFNSNGGASGSISVTVKCGGALGTNMPTAPTRIGYVFTGWNTAADGSGTVFDGATTVSSSLTVYAQWRIRTCTVTYHVAGCDGPSAAPSPQVVDFGGVVTTPTVATKRGYTFSGWYTEVDRKALYEFATPVTADITLYATWVADHTISFDSGGGSVVPAIHQASGSVVTAPAAPTKCGCSFAGWYSTSKLKTPYTFTTMPDSDIKLYAKWTGGRRASGAESKGDPTHKAASETEHTPAAQQRPSEETSRTVPSADETHVDHAHAPEGSSDTPSAHERPQAGSPAEPPKTPDPPSGPAVAPAAKIADDAKPVESPCPPTP